MFCIKCGKQLEEGTSFCPSCGTSQESIATPPVSNSYQPQESASTNTMAIVGFVVSIISLLINFWGIIGIAATILSVLGYINSSKNGQKGKGLALAGIIIGAISILWGCIALLVLGGLF